MADLEEKKENYDEIQAADVEEHDDLKVQEDAEQNTGFMKDKTIEKDSFVPGVGNLKARELTYEMETSYLDYAMSVIVSRALPDVRDGLKPVHRRVIYAMHSTGLSHSARYRKSAKVVGEVIGNYHPHGDVAAYDTLVRLAQDFSMRYPLVDGQGNFGSMDGDSAAAMRYTECRMSAISGEMVADIDKDTVLWQDNYDGSTQEPKVLPARVPQLLLNGTMGIAVGMATNIPPHNLRELVNGISVLIDNPEATIDDLMVQIKGPDFPTGGNIYNTEDIKTAYATGKGKIVMRAKADIEETKKGFRIVIHEIPYQVNKASMIEKMAELVKNKRLDGISDIRDESDRHGVRVVIELRSNSYPKKVLNRLYELTQMQTAFHVNMLALTPDLEPRVMTLKDVLLFYIAHRKKVIERRSQFELKKAKDRAHILEGLKIALDKIDEVINAIRASANREEAKKNLMGKFSFSDKQADAILEMRLSALAALERKKIEDEYSEVLKTIEYLNDLLAHPEKILSLIKKDLKEVSAKFGDDRRTVIIPHALGEFRAEDLIPDQTVIVTLSRGNYIKRQETDVYRKQTRGGVGIVGITTKEEDIVDHIACANTHDDIYFFTNKGRVFKSKVYELPASSRQSKGTPIVNIIQIAPNEKVTAVLTVSKDNGSKYFVMGTRDGQVKKTEIKKYENIRKTGIVAIGLKPEDELKWVKTSAGNDVIVEVTEKGLAICYSEQDVRPMGRSASGVTGMRLRSGDYVMALAVVPFEVSGFDSPKMGKNVDMLIVLENGFGKRTMLKNFHLQKRGGMGIKAANCTARTGNVIGMHITYYEKGDVILASQKGQFIRMELAKIKRLGRDTQGVTLMRLKKDDKVAAVALIENNDEDKIDDKKSGHLNPKKPQIKPTQISPINKPKMPGLAKPIGKEGLKVNYYKEGKISAPKKTLPSLPETSLPQAKPAGHLEVKKSQSPGIPESFKINSYKDRFPEENNGERKFKNPPLKKEEINYWGKANNKL